LGALPPAQASSAVLTYYAAVAAAGWAGAGGNAATNSGSGGGSRRVLERYRVLEPTAVPADAQENPLLARVNVYLRGRSEHDRRDKRFLLAATAQQTAFTSSCTTTISARSFNCSNDAQLQQTARRKPRLFVLAADRR
jgi:hypothetical protein